MSILTVTKVAEAIVYPESDGQPMADNTKQFEYIVTIKNGLDALFHDRPDVFVAGDLLWYPVEGDNRTCTAPDVMVALGRPKGHRGSYQQWIEADIVPQVVFEILSPGNTPMEMTQKFSFYERFGVEEYYLYDPDEGEINGWLRQGGHLVPIEEMRGWHSPRLAIRFELSDDELYFYRPDGRRFETYVELERQREMAEQQRQIAEQQRQIAEQQRELAETQMKEAQARAERLAAQLRSLGVQPEE